jgi:hypothetical protein
MQEMVERSFTKNEEKWGRKYIGRSKNRRRIKMTPDKIF